MATSLKNMPGEGLQAEIHTNGSGGNGNGKGATLPAASRPSRRITDTAAPERFWGWNELLRLGRRYTQKFMGLLPVVLDDQAPGAAHDLRVASRRLEQILSLIYSKPMPAYLRKLRRRVKRCRHLLGDLGDCDILLKIAEGSMIQDPSQDAAAWKAVAQFIQQRRAKIVPRILQKLVQIEFASPCGKLQRDLEENGACRRVYCDGKFQKLTPEKADKIVQQRVVHSLAHLWREFESLVEESREDPCEQVIHGVRIATKRLRNLVEVMKKLGISGSVETLVRLRELQRAIGEWHDLEVLEHVTSEMLVRRKFVRDHLELAVQIEQIFLRHREFKKSSEEKFRRMTVNSRDYQEIKNWVTGKLAGRAQSARQPLIAPRPAPAPPAPVAVTNGSPQ